ncbi:polysaccharide deacetylase family protein [Notoacmeibacter sp. MSK16QG-6]|uniref:polysaccharide deacetylase family protein n=1 Tax=Notoacmeibacter sp. MSK16QG-6 TaxID=2957982 RepID=UPI0020A1C192|nr:polysaccharide deacetylase family protein [Notoacmeibacter sp. MSK16QG-6]MCP1198876.1 polysaccharide deacetylase family protein [Notoacmeibacter sp. MSK16QG-6]
MHAAMKPSFRHLAIRTALEALAATTTAAGIRSKAHHSVIFTLHHVRPASGEPFDPNAHLSVTPEFLDIAIRECLACGFTPVALADLPRRLEAEPDGRFVSFTLDDGYRDNRDHAATVFRRHGVPYTIFLTKGFAQRTSTIWWETAEKAIRAIDAWAIDGRAFDCRTISGKRRAYRYTACMVEKAADECRAVEIVDAEAARSGVSPVEIVQELVMDEDELAAFAKSEPLAHFGVHTLTHRIMSKLSPDTIQQEIADCAEWIGALIGERPTTIAYPYGYDWACGIREAEAAAAAGLSVGVRTTPGKITGAPSELLLLPRVSLNGFYQQRRFVRALLSGRMMKSA